MQISNQCRAGKEKSRLAARMMIWSMVAMLALGWLPAFAAPPALLSAQSAPQPLIPAGCEMVAPEALRDELNRVSQGIFASDSALSSSPGSSPLDIEGMVARQWLLVGMNASIDTAVEDAVIEV